MTNLAQNPAADYLLGQIFVVWLRTFKLMVDDYTYAACRDAIIWNFANAGKLITAGHMLLDGKAPCQVFNFADYRKQIA